MQITGQADSDDPPRKFKPTGYVASLKNGCSIPWRKHITRDFIHLLEVDPDVMSYSRWPDEIVVRFDGQVRQHRTGFRIVRHSEIAFVDIDCGNNPDGLYDAVAEHYTANSQPYSVVAAADILAEPRLSNAKSLLRTRHINPRADFVLAARLALAEGADNLGTLCSMLAAWPDAEPLVHAAVLRGHLRVDLAAAPLGAATRVWA